MKIAYFMSTILEQGGGMEKYLIEAAENMSKYPEVQADVITMDNKFTTRLIKTLSFYYFKKIESKYIHHESLRSIIKKLGDANYIKCHNLSTLKKTLQMYDVIYAKNELLDSFMLGQLLGFNQLPPIVFGVHTPIYFPEAQTGQAKLHNLLYSSVVYKFLLRGAKAIHTINTDDMRICKRLFPTKKVYKITNSFNCSKFINNKNGVKYNFKFDNQKFNIFWSGRLTKEKGAYELFEMINSINMNGYSDKVCWNIAGVGDAKEQLLELKKQHANINYFDYVENRYVASILANIDLFISTSHYETFGFAMIEAQSMDVPVFSFKTSGAEEIVIPNQTDIIVQNKAQFIEEIIRFVNGKHRFNKINQQVCYKFQPEVISNQSLKMFKNVCDK